MPKVIKPHRVVRLEDVIQIPDCDPRLPPEEELDPELDLDLPEGEDQAEAQETDPPAEEAAQAAQRAAQQAAQQAEELSRRMVATARMEREKLLQEARAQVEQIKREAWETAYQESRTAYSGQVEAALADADRALGEMQARQEQYFAEYERELKYTALDIAAKVLHRTLAENSTELADLVREAVASVKNVEWIQVEVSDRLVTLIHQLRKEYAAQDKQVEIVPRPLAPDSCLVHTDQGVVDASVPQQLDNLRQLFEKMDQDRK